MSTSIIPKQPLDYFRIAWQSALAASLCLGLPAGFIFWVMILQRLKPLPVFERVLTLLQDYGRVEIIGLLIGAFAWGIVLTRISGYRPWWRLVLASMVGIYLGRRLFWIIYAWINFDFSELPVRVVLAIHLTLLILSVTFWTGLTYGLILHNWKAALTLALTTSLASLLSCVLIFILLDQFGLRVGAGNAAMPKVTAICTMVAGIIGGMVLGVGFCRFVREEKHPLAVFS